MNEFSIERVSELIRGVIELLWKKPEGLPANDVIARIPYIVELTDLEKEFLFPLRMPRYAKAVRHAILPFVKVGWLTKTGRGQWCLTEDGRNACRRYLRPKDLLLEALRLSNIEQESIPEILVSFELIREEAWATIANYLMQRNSIEIHNLVSALFEAMQYYVTWVAPPTKKHGLIDMVANLDPIGAKNMRILVQIKHTGQPVTVEGLKAFSSILSPNDYGLLFSTGGFTSDVRDTINKGNFQKINAMDLEKFFDVWIRHYDKLSWEAHTLLPLKAVFFLSPPE